MIHEGKELSSPLKLFAVHNALVVTVRGRSKIDRGEALAGVLLGSFAVVGSPIRKGKN